MIMIEIKASNEIIKEKRQRKTNKTMNEEMEKMIKVMHAARMVIYHHHNNNHHRQWPIAAPGTLNIQQQQQQ